MLNNSLKHQGVGCGGGQRTPEKVSHRGGKLLPHWGAVCSWAF